jgi:hypothetical protein
MKLSLALGARTTVHFEFHTEIDINVWIYVWITDYLLER